MRAVVELRRQGISPEEIPNRFPHLSLAEVFDALSYYSDHRGEIQKHIEENRITEEEVHPSTQNANDGLDE